MRFSVETKGLQRFQQGLRKQIAGLKTRDIVCYFESDRISKIYHFNAFEKNRHVMFVDPELLKKIKKTVKGSIVTRFKRLISRRTAKDDNTADKIGRMMLDRFKDNIINRRYQGVPDKYSDAYGRWKAKHHPGKPMLLLHGDLINNMRYRVE